ncbi:MAG TPA: MBL fold metallo-hydrolase [Hyphomicrobiales bacterium]|nr:MBL fold metallo-hydrolase [Hyphomicrobiales bacterium]
MTDSIDFNTDFDITHGVADRLSPLVRRIVAPNPSHFTFMGTCSYIVGHGEVAVIDPGPDDESHIDALLRVLAARNERVSHILVTHTHKDHSPGARLLKKRTGAPVYAQGRHGAGIGAAPSGSPALDAGGDMEFDPDIRVGHGEVIEGEGFALECVFTPGHTSNHMAFALNQEGALFSGDHVMAWSTSVVAPPDGNMGAYMDSLSLLTTRADKVYWPGHGGPVTKPRAFVRAFITHRRMRENAILNRLQAGDRTIDEIVPRIYDGLSPKLVPAAGLSVLAHLQDLVARGMVTSNGEATRDAAFYTA